MIFYKLDDGYDGWGLHLWKNDTCFALTDAAVEGVEWPTPMLPTGIDEEDDAYFMLDLEETCGCINYIVHKGNEKAFGDEDGKFDLSLGDIFYTVQGILEFTYAGGKGDIVVNLAGYGAHWIDANTLLWEEANGATKVELLYKPAADISIENNAVQGGMSISANAGNISAEAAEKFPHISN